MVILRLYTLLFFFYIYCCQMYMVNYLNLTLLGSFAGLNKVFNFFWLTHLLDCLFLITKRNLYSTIFVMLKAKWCHHIFKKLVNKIILFYSKHIFLRNILWKTNSFCVWIWLLFFLLKKHHSAFCKVVLLFRS